MDKKYQIFVSSTYVDLKEERQAVLSVVQDIGDIPSGMELFPASDEEQFKFIKRVIDNCDYYVLIMAGRYGSLASDGISYTEKEYDYAVSKGIHVLAFVRNESEIATEDRETDSSKIQKLAEFKAKVQDGRLSRSWNQKQDLVSSVLISLVQEKEKYPAIGWVRANQVMSNESMVELSDLRKEVAELREYKRQQEEKPSIDDIADFDDQITLHFTHSYWSQHYGDVRTAKETTISWRALFAQLAPSIMLGPTEKYIKLSIESIYQKFFKMSDGSMSISREDFETVKIQLMAYGLVVVQYLQATDGTMAWFWNLTPKGQKEMMENRVIRKK